MRRPVPLSALVLLLGAVCFTPAAPADDVIPAAPVGRVQRQPVRPPVRGPVTPPVAALTDEEALKKANLNPTDGAQLLGYLKHRTLSDADHGRISEIIARFGTDDFDDREAATEEVERYGSAAIGPLKKAEQDRDPEVAYRARLALRKVETVPHSAVTAAAVRAIAKLKPPGAAAGLIGFLPLADSEAVADAIRTALVALAVKDGKAEPALVAALDDKSPARRTAAYIALTEGGPATERVRIKDSYAKLREAVLKEPDAEARFAGLWALALVTREGEYVAALIDLIPKLPRGRIWQLEDLLLTLAGSHPKDGRFLKSPAALEAARVAWLGWWKEKGDRVDLVKLDYKPRVTGHTDVIEMDYTGFGQGRVVSLGPDLKEKWRIVGVNNPTDVKVAPNGHVWIAESNNNQVVERDTTGRILTRRNALQQPLNIDFTPDGGMLVVCRNNVVQWDKDGKQLWAHARPYDIMAGCRLPTGETLYVTNLYQGPGNPGGPNSFRLDAKGADAKKNLTFGWIMQIQALGVVGEDKVLVCERDNKNPAAPEDRVAEYDLKTGKQTWKYECPRDSAPTSCQRLFNGNTLISLMNHNKVIEVDPSGEIVWEYQSKDGLKVGRAFRR
jgi:hypothetical protein